MYKTTKLQENVRLGKTWLIESCVIYSTVTVVYRPHNNPMATLKSIGRKIAQIRVKQKLTQEDLAGMAEIDRSFLSYIENGRKNFSVEMMLKICKVLEIEPDDLFKKK